MNLYSSGKCFLESDKQLILGIIQQGFGSFDAFNETLREVFEQRTINRSSSIFKSIRFSNKIKDPEEKYEVSSGTQ